MRARLHAESPFRSRLYWAAFAAGLAWTLILWARAAPLSSALDDEIGHFLIARDAWAHPQLILNLWGRVGTTLGFVVPAAGGLQVARAAALVMSGATVIVTTQVARLVGVRALALVPLLLWFQPWFHRYGGAVLTDVPFSLTMVAACWAALAGRSAIASLLFGLLPLVRHEGVAVLALWGSFALARRQWRALAVAALPLLVYQALFALVYRTAPFAVYFRATPSGHYGHGGWLHYALPLARSIGPPIALLAVAGLWAGRRNRRLVALAAPYAFYVVVEAVIFRFGLFGSGGNIDFLLPVASFAAIAAALGTEWIITVVSGHDVWRVAPRAISAPLAVGAIVTLAAVGYALRTSPAHADRAAEPMRQAVRFLERQHTALGQVTATHVWYFALSAARIPVGDGAHSPWSRPPPPRTLPPRATVVWDCFYSNRFGLRWRALASSGFRELAPFGRGRVVVLRRGAGGSPLGRQPRCRA